MPNKERYKIIMDDILIFSTRQQHWENLENLFHVLIKFGLKISPHKCQLFRDKLIYMGLEFLIKDGTAHYTAMCDKCDVIRNMKAPKSVKECRTFCGMVNFLSTFCKNLRQLLIPIYELTKKHARFTWTDKHQKAFDDIKQLLVKPPILRMVSGNGFFRLESDTSRTAAGATLYQWQNNEWVLVGYHSKRLPDAVRNYGVTELELTGLLANIHGFEQKLNNNYFETIVDHKAIDYLIKSKHEPTSTRLVTLLDRLRPILHAAKQKPEFRYKSSMDGSNLVIDGKRYSVSELDKLPQKLRPFEVTTKSNDDTIGFFGELCPFSNFHPAAFIHNGQSYHSGEQLIQHQKALHCNDSRAADRILATKTAIACKQLSYTIQNYDQQSWTMVAKDRCLDGLKAKFVQNPELLRVLLSTGSKLIVECSKDHIWGTGIPLYRWDCLHRKYWSGNGLLSELLMEIRDSCKETTEMDIQNSPT